MDHSSVVVVRVVQSLHFTILYLASMGTVASSTTQQLLVMVVQSMHQTLLDLASMEPTTLLAT